MLLALLGAAPRAAGTWTTEFEGTLGRVGDGGYTQALSHDGALWVSTQSYGDDNVNVRNLTVLTCGAEPPRTHNSSFRASGSIPSASATRPAAARTPARPARRSSRPGRAPAHAGLALATTLPGGACEDCE